VDQRPVSDTSVPERSKPPSWRLAKPIDALTQAVAVSGFGDLPHGRALFLEFAWDGNKGGGAWLQALEKIAPITNADGREERAAGLSFAYTGLVKMGLPKATLESFAAPYKEGMLQEDRLRRLGDRRKGEWLETVIDGGPKWSANTPQRGALTEVEAGQSQALTATGHREERIVTPVTVHALLLLYDKSIDGAAEWAAAVEKELALHSVKIVHWLPLELLLDEKGIGREHFGFADGISQLAPFDKDGAVVLSTGGPAPKDKWNGVPLGEILFGYTNGHHEKAPGPLLPDDKDGKGLAAGLVPHPLAEGFLDLGINGSYMVVRELKQDVVAFWQSMREGAALIRQRDPDHSSHVTTTWLAERAVGRNTKGDLLCPAGYLPPNQYDQPENDFGFFDRDLHGLGCPAGSHVRRANPRDGLAPSADQKQTLLDAANNHRILRRGRKYGATISIPPKEDGVDRGLLFICLNTDIARQFEFVQQTWMFNPNFATLYDETDPLIGPAGTMTISEHPLRRRIDVKTFVRMAGGDYFFLPSMPALRYFASL
jgi:deferrochelatase/peroxidase EfeB